MSFFRSDPLGHFKLIIPRQSAWHIMNFLGQLNMIHFVKCHHLIQNNPYASQMKRCEQSLHKIENLQGVLWQQKMYNPTQYFTKSELFQILKSVAQKHQQLEKQKSMSMLNQIENQVDEIWMVYQEMKTRLQKLQKQVKHYRQNIAIVIAGQRIFGVKRLSRSSMALEQAHNHFGNIYENEGVLRIKFGILNKSQQQKFSRSLFRITRGHSYAKFISFEQIYQQTTEKQKIKSLYFLVFQGTKNSHMQKKMNKFVQSYDKTAGAKFKLPNQLENQKTVLKDLNDAYNSTYNLIILVEKELDNFMREKLLGFDEKSNHLDLSEHKEIEKFSKIQMMKVFLLQQLQIFNLLKQMDVFTHFLQAEVYLRYDEFQQLKRKLTDFQKQMRHPSVHIIPIGSGPSRSSKKPSLFQVNSFTRSAQQIVQTYGVSRYREANPSLFTCVTFPFLFGVMFGDIGHGLILFMFGIIMIFKKYALMETSPLFVMIIPHRYLFALMGFFSTYCGFVYNDFLSMNLNLFGSCYDPASVQEHHIIPRQQNCIYSFGVDPVWGVAENNLNYINSLKMKIAVIIGVVHMTLGVIVKALNSIYFKKKVQLFFQVIPQLVFLTLVFGYMDFLIIFKWLKPWGYNNANAPSIITSMINLPLLVGKTDKQCCHGGGPMWGQYNLTSQDAIQKVILFIALICIPLMLLVKPLYEINKNKKLHEKGKQIKENSIQDEEPGYLVLQEEQDEEIVIKNIRKNDQLPSFEAQKDILADMDVDDHGDADASEIFVHQMIQTIEFVLGCISNTASYLRLWALSLAHSQLSDVFMEKTLIGSFENGYLGIPGMLIFFPMFAMATFGVLMCMDVMECFLHTLRLHWVEFQNKFYKGDGYAFGAFDFLSKINQQIKKTKYQQVKDNHNGEDQ